MRVPLFGWRQRGRETCGERIWWNHVRPVHAMLLATAALLCWDNTRPQAAGIVLLLDALLGLSGAGVLWCRCSVSGTGSEPVCAASLVLVKNRPVSIIHHRGLVVRVPLLRCCNTK